jgi:transcriptional regulator with XRE-family HTH domain
MFNQTLKRALLERGISQKELAASTGLSKSGISQYVSGAVVPPLKTRRRIADAMSVPLSFFDGAPASAPGEPPDTRRLGVAEAAARLGKSQQFVRVLLQSGKAPFGVAVRMPGGKYGYHISPKKFDEYVGGPANA